MKLKYLGFPIMIAIFATLGFGQQVTISGKKVTYGRTKPQYDFKKRFTINYPIAKAATPLLSKRITTAISPVSVLDIRLKDEMGEYQWLEEADYEVKYNRNGVLCVDLFMEGTAAYPSGVTKTVVIDTKTGAVARSVAVFTNRPALVAKLNESMKAEIAEAIIAIKKDPDMGDEDPARLFESSKFHTAELDGFLVSEEGVTFKFDYGFPHVIQALQPAGMFLVKWAELKPFLKPGGLLARLSRYYTA